VSTEQKTQIDTYVSQLGDRRYFIAGHHDWQSISRQGAPNLHAAFHAPGFITYISAHTHDPTATGGAFAD